jgi:hypothetical protein
MDRLEPFFNAACDPRRGAGRSLADMREWPCEGICEEINVEAKKGKRRKKR